MHRKAVLRRRGEEMKPRNHFFIKTNTGWIIKCKNKDKEFKPSIFDDNGGFCPYCNEHVRSELEKNKIPVLKKDRPVQRILT